MGPEGAKPFETCCQTSGRYWQNTGPDLIPAAPAYAHTVGSNNYPVSTFFPAARLGNGRLFSCTSVGTPRSRPGDCQLTFRGLPTGRLRSRRRPVVGSRPTRPPTHSGTS